jgi:hypothetical protein
LWKTNKLIITSCVSEGTPLVDLLAAESPKNWASGQNFKIRKLCIEGRQIIVTKVPGQQVMETNRPVITVASR